MKVNFKFFRSAGGVGYFARMEVDSEAGAQWNISLGNSQPPIPHRFLPHVKAGLDQAITAYKKRSDQCFSISVTSFVIHVADVREAVVECTAAAAAWCSFGNPEPDALIKFVDGRWTIAFGDD